MIRFPSRLSAVLLATASLGAQAAGIITITDPYARAVPPGYSNSAVYMTLENGSMEDRALVAAECPAAEVVELHTHLHEDGVMKMRRVDRIDIPAGQTVTLKPGGLHLMLIGLKETLEPGKNLHLTLSFDNGNKEQVVAASREIGMAPMSH
jgi:hypothetical protein